MAAVTLLFVFFFLNKGNAAFKSLQRGRDMLLNLLIFLWDFSPDSTNLNVCTVIDCSELLIILKWITHFQSLYKNTCISNCGWRLKNCFFSLSHRGLILQDLTFIHIGNQDLLPDGSINFAKRWQQFNILDNMRRFKKW